VALHDLGLANHNFPVKIHSVTYKGPEGDRVSGYLAVPPGKGPFAGVVFVPGAGATALEWAAPAADLASRGAITLAITPSFVSRGNVTSSLTGVFVYRAGFNASVLDVRRALDVLAARPDVDPNRLAVVGHSLGAAVSGVVAGVDRRPRAVVLIAPPQHAHFRPPLSSDVKAQAGSLLRNIEPTRYLPSTHAAVLLALAKHDQDIPRSEYDAVVAATPKGRTVRWYNTGHSMSPAALGNILDWLAGKLELGPVPAYARQGSGG
jgi:dienelactone hydrolase